MLHRRTFLFAAATMLVAIPANAGLRERLKEHFDKRHEVSNAKGEAARLRTSVKPVTEDYGPALLDIYAPANAPKLPVMIYVHGGGWKHGDRTYVQTKPELFLKSGYIFVSIDYRMLPDVGVATEAKDVEAAYAWVRGNIAKYGGDPARIAVMGHSAGAHLVALTGLRGGLPGAKALFFDDVEAYDLLELAGNGHMRRVYGDAFSDPSQWRELSPATYAARGGHPPILIAYSRVKGHKEASESLAARLRAAGDNVELFDGRQYTHGEINRGIGAGSTAVTDTLLAFLSKHMG